MLLLFLCLAMLLSSLVACNRRNIISTETGESQGEQNETQPVDEKIPVPFSETTLGKKDPEELLAEFEALQDHYWPIEGTPYYRTSEGANYHKVFSMMTGELLDENRNPLDEKAAEIWSISSPVGCWNGRYYIFYDGFGEETSGFYSVDYMLNDLRFESPTESGAAQRAFVYDGKIYYSEQKVESDLQVYQILYVLDLSTKKISTFLKEPKNPDISQFCCVYRGVVYYSHQDGSIYANNLTTGNIRQLMGGQPIQILRIVEEQMLFKYINASDELYLLNLETDEITLFEFTSTEAEDILENTALDNNLEYAYGFLDHTTEEWKDHASYELYCSKIMSYGFQWGGELYRMGRDGELELFYKGETNGKPDHLISFQIQSEFGIVNLFYYTYDDLMNCYKTGEDVKRYRIYLDAVTGDIMAVSVR